MVRRDKKSRRFRLLPLNRSDGLLKLPGSIRGVKTAPQDAFLGLGEPVANSQDPSDPRGGESARIHSVSLAWAARRHRYNPEWDVGRGGFPAPVSHRCVEATGIGRLRSIEAGRGFFSRPTVQNLGRAVLLNRSTNRIHGSVRCQPPFHSGPGWSSLQ